MNIYSASKYLEQGMLIKRPNSGFFVVQTDISRVIKKVFEDGTVSNIFYIEDFIANDWEIFSEENK